jgi:REP element-mobilizing transposase RayT
MRRGRRSIRLPEYDYASAGGYFVTITAHKRSALFGRINNEVIDLNSLGHVAEACWTQLPVHFPSVTLDAFIVMPSHLHGILLIHEKSTSAHVGAQHAAPLSQDRSRIAPGSLGAIVRSYKAAVTKSIREFTKQPDLKVWQRNYYERVIRDQRELDETRFYILHNAIPHS